MSEVRLFSSTKGRAGQDILEWRITFIGTSERCAAANASTREQKQGSRLQQPEHKSRTVLHLQGAGNTPT